MLEHQASGVLLASRLHKRPHGEIEGHRVVASAQPK
jgi:hypothetical protein